MSSAAIVTMGETMACFRSIVGRPLAMVTSMDVSPAGAESNVAIAASRLGTTAAWIGRVGDDGFGEMITRTLRSESVSTESVIIDPDAETGLMFKERRSPTSSRVWYRRAGSAGSRLRPEDIGQDVVGNATWLHVTGITSALSDSAREAVHAAVDIAHDRGTLVSFDINHRTSLWTETAGAASEYRSLVGRCDLLLAGDDEAGMLVSPDSPGNMGRALTRLGPTRVIIKLGARGSVGIDDDGIHVQPATTVAILDPVGAGDAFAGALLSELVRGVPLRDAQRLASRVGAWAVATSGDWEGLPTRVELDLIESTEGHVAR